jgi:hypothetical protein
MAERPLSAPKKAINYYLMVWESAYALVTR